MKICEWMPIQKSMLCTHACTHIERHTHTHKGTCPKETKERVWILGALVFYFFSFFQRDEGRVPKWTATWGRMNATWMAELAWLGHFFCFFLGMKHSGKEITWSRECAVGDESRGATWTGPAPARARLSQAKARIQTK